jgi:hypothetical protein
MTMTDSLFVKPKDFPVIGRGLEADEEGVLIPNALQTVGATIRMSNI